MSTMEDIQVITYTTATIIPLTRKDLSNKIAVNKTITDAIPNP